MLLNVRDELVTLKLASTFTSSSGISGITFKNTSKSKIFNDENEEEEIEEEKKRLKMDFKANDLHSGRHLIYVNSIETQKETIVFTIYPLREKHKRSSHLRIPIKVEILKSVKEEEIPLKVSLKLI